MRKITLLMAISLVLFSCEKNPDNLTVVLDQSGTLNVHVKDNDNAIDGATVAVSSSMSDSEIIYEDSTGVDGICNVGKILQGQYECYVSAKKGNKVYEERKNFQVIAGNDKSIEFNPFENAGDAMVYILDYWNEEPIEGVNVALIQGNGYRYSNYIDDDNFEHIIDNSVAIGKTDTEGKVEFLDLPSGMRSVMSYTVLVYHDKNNYDFYERDLYISKGAKSDFKVRVRLN